MSAINPDLETRIREWQREDPEGFNAARRRYQAVRREAEGRGFELTRERHERVIALQHRHGMDVATAMNAVEAEDAS